ncbi:MAG: hypothetical protein K0Q99_540 [Clostridia bacterium]|jgi:hypothetical protein|nr:hypothetical protein [Clostridia bacterium]
MSKHHHHHKNCPNDTEEIFDRLVRNCYYYGNDFRPGEDFRLGEDFRPSSVLPIADNLLPLSLRPRNNNSRRSCYDYYCPEEEALYEKLLKQCGRCDCDDKKCEPHFTKDEACKIAKLLGVNINSPCFNLDQFWMGLNVELEHGTINPGTNITNNDPIMTGKIALAHLNEIPDYYTRLARMRKEAREYWRRIGLSI